MRAGCREKLRKTFINRELHHVPGLDDSISMVSILPKMIRRFSKIPVKVPARFWWKLTSLF